MCPSHLAQAEPAAGEGHKPHELLLIPPRAHPHGSSSQHSQPVEQPRTWSQAQLSWLPNSCFSPPGLCFGQGPSPWGLHSKLVSSSLPCSQRTSVGCAFPAAAAQHQRLVGPQILPWLLLRGGRGGNGQRKRGAAGEGREILAIALACPPEEKHLIKSRCRIQGCYSFPILLACLILLNLFKAFQKKHVIPKI